jgi:hypothetical protein
MIYKMIPYLSPADFGVLLGIAESDTELLGILKARIFSFQDLNVG